MTETKRDLRRDMPNTAAKVDEYRQTYGADWVNDQIRRALRGEPDRFYAMENGHVLGTPFQADPALADWIKTAVALGSRFAVVMRPPEGAR